jgi:hypothetical protein
MTEENIEQSLPSTTWADIRLKRDQMLLDAERGYNFDTPEEIQAAWRAYKQQLRDLPATYADLEDLSLIEWPTSPASLFTQQLTLSGR